MAGRNDLEKEKNVLTALLVAISIGAIGSVGLVVNKILKNGKATLTIMATITALAAKPLGKVIHFKEIKGLTELMKLLK